MSIVRTRKREGGVTLLELMIAVAIVGILASVAYPNYKKHLIKTRRALAQAALANGQNAMERFFTEKYTYLKAAGNPASGVVPPCVAASATATDTGAAPCIFYSNNGAQDYYTFTIAAASASGYTLRAAPIAGKSQATDGYLELVNTGERRWDKNNDNSISTGEKVW